MTDVTSFGIWGDSTLKVFVQKKTNDKKLKDELMKVNTIFFENFELEIVKGKMLEKKNLKIGDTIGTDIQNGTEEIYGGTLGGFVTTNDNSKVYALTCHHVFPSKNQAAYTNYPCEEIGTCVFTTTEKSCDFAAIEVQGSYLNKCDKVFRRDDKKRVNAKLYTESLSNLGLVYKIGAATDVTRGHIVSCEYYDKIFDGNRDNIFLVHGIGTNFSASGDSGSLVFSRPRNLEQKHVEVVGMVYANNITIYDDYDDDDNDADNGLRGDEHISLCYRIHTALELFKENQGGEFEVRFKDDLSSASSSSPSSSSSDSDD